MMYQGLTQQTRLKCCCSTFILIIGPMMLFMGIIFLAIIGGGASIPGAILILAGFVMLIAGIVLCVFVRRAAHAQTENNEATMRGQPLVSGFAPPGSIAGYHVQSQPQAMDTTGQRYPSQPILHHEPIQHHESQGSPHGAYNIHAISHSQPEDYSQTGFNIHAFCHPDEPSHVQPADSHWPVPSAPLPSDGPPPSYNEVTGKE